MKARSYKCRAKKKRTFRGNQHSKEKAMLDVSLDASQSSVETSSDHQVATCSSSSVKKLKRSHEAAFSDRSTESSASSNETTGYIFMDVSILISMFAVCSNCPECSSTLSIVNDLSKRKGLACCVYIHCEGCGWYQKFYSSHQFDRPNKNGPKPYDINVRSVVAFREIGKGYESIKKFCGLMNTPPPMSKSTFITINDNIADSYMNAAEKSMKDAAIELKELNNTPVDNLLDIDVSGDGAWSKRGFASLNGFVTLVAKETGKCLDFRVLTKKCKACTHWERRKGTVAYDDFKANHKCPLNHKGSSGSMESKGLVECFMSSVNTRGIRYKRYIGDGDSSTYGDIVKANPYSDLVIEKG